MGNFGRRLLLIGGGILMEIVCNLGEQGRRSERTRAFFSCARSPSRSFLLPARRSSLALINGLEAEEE